MATSMSPGDGMKIIKIALAFFLACAAVGALSYGLFYATILTGNFWCTESGVERELKIKDDSIVEVLSIERNIFADSRVLTHTKYGTHPIYCLDTNVLFNYTFTPCSK